MFWKIYQLTGTSEKYFDEIVFMPLLVSVILVNKYVLSELNFTVPTVFQGWQTFVCVLLLSLLMKLEKIKNELQVLDKRTVLHLLPVLTCFTISIVAGSKALADLPVPIFLAVTNLAPAILVLLKKRNSNDESSSIKICGCVAICGTVVTIVISHLNRWNSPAYLWLGAHVLLNLVQTLYLQNFCLNLSNMTKIYYRNFFSIIALLPISIWLNVIHLPSYVDWRFYFGCFLSGVLGTFLQMWTFKIEARSNLVDFQSFSKMFASLVAHMTLFVNVEPPIWILIGINLFVGMFVLNVEEKSMDDDVKNKIVVADASVGKIGTDI